MGTRLSLVTVVGGLCLASSVLAQPRPPAPAPRTPTPAPIAPQAGPGPLPAADFAKQGNDKYNAGDYAGAVEPFKKAHEMEPNNFEYRFMLAQSLRQSGNCGEAKGHYDALSTSAPPERAEDVKSGAAACAPQPKPVEPPKPAPPPPPPETVVVHGGVGTTNGALLVASGLGLGAGLALFWSAHNDDADANDAASYHDHDRISTRADRLRIAAAVSAGAGVVFGVIAVLRIRSSSNETEVAITPKKGGGMLVLERSW